jgi:hypothetical protein
VQHAVVYRWSGIVVVSAHPSPELVTIPGLQHIIPLRFMLRCARETFDLRASLPGFVPAISMTRASHCHRNRDGRGQARP